MFILCCSGRLHNIGEIWIIDIIENNIEKYF